MITSRIHQNQNTSRLWVFIRKSVSVKKEHAPLVRTYGVSTGRKKSESDIQRNRGKVCNQERLIYNAK